MHYGQVDCVAQGDLCSRLEVKYYPYLRLYQDGNHSDVYGSPPLHLARVGAHESNQTATEQSTH